MIKLLAISVFGRVNAEGNDRINSLHDYLTFDVKILTTDFSHQEKKYRAKDSFRNVDYLNVTPYKKNLSLGRILSHWVFACKMFFYLIRNAKQYEVVYCINPTPSSAFIAGIYKIFYPKTFLIIDVIDIWPEGLLPIGKTYKRITPILWPWKYMSVVALKCANAIFAATNHYKELSIVHNTKAFSAFFPLGIDKEKIDSIRCLSKLNLSKSLGEIWIAYAGNLGNSYDFDTMISALEKLCGNSHGLKIKFVIIGGGDREGEIKEKIFRTSIDFILTGNIGYADYLFYLHNCDIGLNIYMENSIVIQSYKFNDYIVSGLFVINNLMGETAELIEKYKVGVNIKKGNKDLKLTLEWVLNNWRSIQAIQKYNCAELISAELDKKTIYQRMQLDISTLIKNHYCPTKID